MPPHGPTPIPARPVPAVQARKESRPLVLDEDGSQHLEPPKAKPRGPSPESSFGRVPQRGGSHCHDSLCSKSSRPTITMGQQVWTTAGSQSQGFLQCHSTKTATYPVKEGQRRGRLGSLTREPSLEGTEERTIGPCTHDRAGTSRQDRSRAVRGRWPVEQPRRKPPFHRHTARPTQKCENTAAAR